MIPISLRLTDFLSYKEMSEPLDFTGLHVACLSGANGHGKSALLDAITWALWGKARGCEGGHDQDRVIRDGAEAAAVELVFALEDQTYRVRRTRWRTGRSELQFAVRAPDGWTDLAGEGLRRTEEHIEGILRMDYETFVASAFILQGRADTFTRLDPARRKEVLGRILGLETYERLAERAKERRKDSQAVAEARKAELGILERDLAGRPEEERRLAEAQAALDLVTGEREALAPRLADAGARLDDLRSLAQAAAQAVERAEEAAERAQAEQAEASSLREAEADLAARADAPATWEVLAAETPALEERERALEDARARHDELAAEAASLEARIREERARLETEERGLEATAGELDGELAREPEAAAVLAAARETLAGLETASARRDERLAAHSEIVAALAALEADAATRARRRAEDEEKLDLIEGEGASCPLCGEPLTAAHRKEIRAQLRAALRSLDAADKAAGTERRSLEKRKAAVEREGAEVRRMVAERDRLAETAAQLEERLAAFEGLRARRERTVADRERVAHALAAEDFAAAEREKLAGVRSEIAATGHDPAALAAVRERLAEARRVTATLQDARAAAERLAEVRARITSVLARADAAARDAAAARADADGMAARLAGLAEAERLATGLEEESRRLDERRVAAMADATAAARALEALVRTEEEASAVRERHRDATRQASLYEKLAKIFGRDGIPARIVANAIPELRTEANDLLRLLSDGRLTVSIDSLRETKARTVKEALEVTVYDALGGKRPYEMYSGGERLRIDFALRVALSRLLARRAGARLETLVVDEGFGSQDAEGRARLVEAIIRVRDLFRLVLVITHIEELKEQFPARIDVTKDDVEGSRARVV